MQIFKTPNINFMRYKYIALALSLLVITIGLVNITAGKGLSSGIDFAGGALIQVRFAEPMPIGELRQTLNDAGLAGSKISEVDDEGALGEREFIIRAMLPEEDTGLETHEIIARQIIDILKTDADRDAESRGLKDLNNSDAEELTLLFSIDLPENSREIAEAIIDWRESAGQKGLIENIDMLAAAGLDAEILAKVKEKTFAGSLAVKRRETVGPQVGKDLRRKATQATIWALIGMLIYIGIRFRIAYGVSAIMTLAHDVLITMGLFSLTNREVNLPVIAAIMTIVGYSLNDTIVIFDRVRDNLKTMRKHEFNDILNSSINQTLSRTVITSGTTFMTVLVLFLFGGEVINDFAFTMMLGVIIGTYSSIYQSCSLLYFWKKIFKPKKGMGK